VNCAAAIAHFAQPSGRVIAHHLLIKRNSAAYHDHDPVRNPLGASTLEYETAMMHCGRGAASIRRNAMPDSITTCRSVRGRILAVPVLRPLAAVAALLALASGAIAQTPFSSLANPNGPPGSSRPAPSAKAGAAAPVKSCSNYGAGYVAVPGTNTCVKIGTAVQIDATANVGR
jgi:hypothetical protein